MIRTTSRLLLLIALVVAGTFGLYSYRAHNSIEAELQRQQERAEQLRLVVQRLGVERRVADVIVTDQKTVAGVLRTEILFVEYAPDGHSLPARRFTLEGKTIHLDAEVVKFDGKFIEDNDPLRGHSVALFTRLYGETQTPAEAFHVDEPGSVPEVYRSPDPKVAAFQQELWQNFWRLADDADYRTRMGVRIAQGEGVWRPFEPGRLYTITLESAGGLNIRSEPLKGIYSEALKSHASAN